MPRQGRRPTVAQHRRLQQTLLWNDRCESDPNIPTQLRTGQHVAIQWVYSWVCLGRSKSYVHVVNWYCELYDVEKNKKKFGKWKLTAQVVDRFHMGRRELSTTANKPGWALERLSAANWIITIVGPPPRRRDSLSVVKCRYCVPFQQTSFNRTNYNVQKTVLNYSWTYSSTSYICGPTTMGYFMYAAVDFVDRLPLEKK